MSETLKPWYAIATPHEDIREGRLAEAVFAANLWAVVQGTAPEVYLDPEEFFRKTYLTTGLSTVLNRVAAALRGGGETADRIISLQTAFGGGKTHTLVALWRLAKHADRLKGSPQAEGLRKAVGRRLPEKVKGVAVFTNQTCDATQGRKVEDDVHLCTQWGELVTGSAGRLFTSACGPTTRASACRGGSSSRSCIQQLTESVQQVPVGSSSLCSPRSTRSRRATLRVRGQVAVSCALWDARRTSQEHLGYVWTMLVEDEEWILRRVGSVALQSTGLIPKKGGLRLKDVVETFLRFTDKPMIAAKETVTAGLAQACADGLVGIGPSVTLARCKAGTASRRWRSTRVRRRVDYPAIHVGAGEGPGGRGNCSSWGRCRRIGPAGGTGSATTTGEKSGTATAAKPRAKGTARRLVVCGDVPVENWGELFRCFVGPAARMNLKKPQLGVQSEMQLPEAGE